MLRSTPFELASIEQICQAGGGILFRTNFPILCVMSARVQSVTNFLSLSLLQRSSFQLKNWDEEEVESFDPILKNGKLEK